VIEALKSRFSCRAFLDEPVPAITLQHILENAIRAPSGSNMQPCKIHVLESGEKRTLLQRLIQERFPESPRGEGSGLSIYPEKITDDLRKRRSECGEALYRTLGIPREDKLARYREAMKNAEFFGAPVGLIITVDSCIGDAQLVDCGILVQTIMLLAEEEGLSTCAQAFWAMWQDTVSEILGIENELVAVGLAIGYKDSEAAVNNVVQTRLGLDEVVTAHD